MRGIRIDPETERRIIELYKLEYERPQQKLSMDKVAELLGISRSTVHRTLIRNNEPRRSISEACMKYPKTDFSGDLVEMARIIGFIEDSAAGNACRQIHIQTTTTHPAQMKYFDNIFGRYGHAKETPCYHKQFSVYEWHLRILLNPSFDFLPEYKKNPMKFLTLIAENGYEIVRIASFTDAEGWVGIDANKGHPQPILSISNQNRQILEWTQRTVGGNIRRDKDGFQLQLRGEEVVEVIRRLPIMHEEKVAAKELILRHYDNGGIGLDALKEYQELRRKIDEEVRLCTLQARLEWIRRHDKPHKDDPDQTIPLIQPSLPLFPYVELIVR